MTDDTTATAASRSAAPSRSHKEISTQRTWLTHHWQLHAPTDATRELARRCFAFYNDGADAGTRLERHQRSRAAVRYAGCADTFAHRQGISAVSSHWLLTPKEFNSPTYHAGCRGERDAAGRAQTPTWVARSGLQPIHFDVTNYQDAERPAFRSLCSGKGY